jgi:hypothetical protein
MTMINVNAAEFRTAAEMLDAASELRGLALMLLEHADELTATASESNWGAVGHAQYVVAQVARQVMSLAHPLDPDNMGLLAELRAIARDRGGR